MKYDGLIFDVDGTLWDSTKVVADAWNPVFARSGFAPFLTPDILKKEFGKPLEVILEGLLPEAPADLRSEMLEQLYEVENDCLASAPPAPYAGLEDTLRQLYGRIPMYVVSNCQAGYIESFYAATGLGHYFDDHLCPGDTGKLKANNIRTIARRYGLMRGAYIGDIQGDCDATREAGLSFIWAAYGFGTAEHPDAVIRDISELPALVFSEE